MKWAAKRATGESWYTYAFETLTTIHDPVIAQALDLAACTSLDPEFAKETAWYKNDLKVMQKFINYATDICNGICWHHIRNCWCLPDLVAAIFHEDHAIRKGKLDLVKRITEAILKIEKFQFAIKV